MNNEILGAEKVADHRDRRGMAADKSDSRLGAVQFCESSLQLPVKRSFASNNTTRRDRGAVAFDRLLGCLVYLRMTTEAQIVIAREIDHAPTINHGRRTRRPLVAGKEGVLYPEFFSSLKQQRELLESRDFLPLGLINASSWEIWKSEWLRGCLGIFHTLQSTFNGLAKKSFLHLGSHTSGFRGGGTHWRYG